MREKGLQHYDDDRAHVPASVFPPPNSPRPSRPLRDETAPVSKLVPSIAAMRSMSRTARQILNLQPVLEEGHIALEAAFRSAPSHLRSLHRRPSAGTAGLREKAEAHAPFVTS
jgi:hypothetical protein